MIRNGTQTQQIVSFVGQAARPQKLLVRADLLVAPGTLEKTSLQLEYLPSGDVCRGQVTNVGGDELQRHVPAPERRAADDRGELGAERGGNRRRRPDQPEWLSPRSRRSWPSRVLAAGCGSGAEHPAVDDHDHRRQPEAAAESDEDRLAAAGVLQGRGGRAPRMDG